MRPFAIVRPLALASLAAGTVIGIGALPADAAPPTPAPGGSNYNWFQLQGCDREPFGVIRNYGAQTARIDQQLKDMYAQGQRRLTLSVFHRSGSPSGTLLDSTGGRLTDQDRQNLTGVLAKIKEIGFSKVILSMAPQAQNLPTNTDYDPATYEDNLNFLKDVRSVAKASGEPYVMDLLNEGVPEDDAGNPTQVAALHYAQRLWRDYTAAFGVEDTDGFSIIGGDSLRFGSVAKIYGDNPPPVLNLHFYGPPDFSMSEHDEFVAAHKSLTAAGYPQPWIVGETYYNDPTAAKGIRVAMDETGHRVLWLAEWPKTRANPQHCDQVDVAPPTDFSGYGGQGFDSLPAAVPDAATTKAGHPVTVDVLANDRATASDVPFDTDSLTVLDPRTGKWSAQARTSQGLVSVAGSPQAVRAAATTDPAGRVTFTPADGYTGRIEPIRYQVRNSYGDLVGSTLTVTVEAAAAPTSQAPTTEPPTTAPSNRPTAPSHAPTSAPPATQPPTTEPPSSAAPLPAGGNGIDSGLGAEANEGTDWTVLTAGFAAIAAALAGAAGYLAHIRRKRAS